MLKNIMLGGADNGLYKRNGYFFFTGDDGSRG